MRMWNKNEENKAFVKNWHHGGLRIREIKLKIIIAKLRKLSNEELR